jgi:hypothetical protein
MGGRATNGEVNDAKGKAAALAWIRVLPEIEPFFRRPGFVIIRAQCLVAHWPGNCGLVVAGSATAGAGHGLRRLGVGCEDADCSASSTGGAYGRHGGLLRCVNADGPHVVVFGALSTSAMHYLASRIAYLEKKAPAETWLSLGPHELGLPGRCRTHRREATPAEILRQL